MSGNRQFVDTNVLVYAHDVTAGDKHSRARALVEELWDTREGCLSVQVLQELFVTTTRKIPKPLDAAAAAARSESEEDRNLVRMSQALEAQGGEELDEAEELSDGGVPQP